MKSTRIKIPQFQLLILQHQSLGNCYLDPKLSFGNMAQFPFSVFNGLEPIYIDRETGNCIQGIAEHNVLKII